MYVGPTYLSVCMYVFMYVCMYVGMKEMFYLTTHSTHFIYGYMASDIWQRATQRLLFPISSKGSFICTIPQIG